MDFDLSEEEQMLESVVRKVAMKKIAPISAQIEEEDKIPDDIIRKLADMGIFGISFSSRCGGSERSYVERPWQ